MWETRASTNRWEIGWLRSRGTIPRRKISWIKACWSPTKAGAPAIDIIDIDYPPWHNDTDTMDKLSAQSMEIVGTVVYEVIQRLERQ